MTLIDEILLQDNAIFVADSHFKNGDNAMLEIFSNIPKNRQIFLMGDVFHLLIGALQSSRSENAGLIEIICKLSFSNTIFVLEGNHDFSLDSIWQHGHSAINRTICGIEYNPQNIRIYPHKMQPLIMKDDKNKIYMLAHGDLWITPFYDTYRKILDSKAAILAFKMLDMLSCGIIYRNISCRVAKRFMAEFSFYRSDFSDFMLGRISCYKKHIIDLLIRNDKANHDDIFCIIEGHFHLGKSLKQDNINYISLPSMHFTKEVCSNINREV